MMKTKTFKIPILFVVFNRLDIAKKSFEAIRLICPEKLYIASDGPRTNIIGEKQIVETVRNSILEMVDWECKVKTLFQEKNLGCGPGVHTAINWLFDNEEKGIILEDDCLSSLSFFPYVNELLEKYEKDDRIGMIAGFNTLGKIPGDESYCFSKYKGCWGWATWRRAWINMDINMSWRKARIKESIIENTGYRGKDIRYWKYRIKLIDNKVVSAWDWQWYFSLSAQNQLTIFPAKNLISNIGFGEGATHSTIKISKKSPILSELEFPLKHPHFIVPDLDFDRQFYHKNNTLFYQLMRYIPVPIKGMIKKCI